MADAPNTSTYVLVNPDVADLPNSRTLIPDVANGVQALDTGVGGTLQITTVGHLRTLSNFDTSGVVCFDTGANTYFGRSLASDLTISISNPEGAGGNPTFSVNNNTSIQQIKFASTGTINSTRSILNFIPGNLSTGITVQDNVGTSSCDVTITGTPGAPLNATYITQTPSGSLTSEQALSLLTTGILKSTTGTGVVSIASPTADYLPYNANLASIAALTPTLGRLLIGNGTAWTNLDIGSASTVLTSNGTSASWQVGGGGGSSVIVEHNGGSPGTATTLNFADGGSVTWTVSAPSAGVVTITPIGGGGGGLPAPTLGSMIYGNGTNFVDLAVGTAGQILTVSGGLPSWQTGGGGGIASISSPRGTIAVGGGSAATIDVQGYIYNTGLANVFLGINVGNNTTSGDNNQGMGIGVLSNLTTGRANSAMGSVAMSNMLTGSFNVAFGSSSLAVSTADTNNTAMGQYTLDSLNGNGSNSNYNVAVGSEAGRFLSTGQHNTFVGGLTLGPVATNGNNNTFIGYSAGNNGASLSYTNCTFLGSGAISNTIGNPTNQFAIGYNSQVRSNYSGNIGGGSLSLVYYNVGINQSIPLQSLHVGIGANTITGATSSTAAIMMDQSTTAPTGTAGTGIIYVDNSSPTQLHYVNSAGTDIVLGSGGGGGIPTSIFTATGQTLYASAPNTPAALNIGTSGQVLSVVGGLPSWVTLGGGSGVSAITSTGNSIVVTGSPVVNLEVANLLFNSSNIFYGVNAGLSGFSGTNNSGFGVSALASITTATNNTAVGSHALELNSINNKNTAIGAYALAVLNSVTADTANTVIGYQGGLNLATGSDNTLVGSWFLTPAMTGGSANTFVGTVTGIAQTTYNNCTFLGGGTDATISSPSYATAIGAGALVSQSYSIALGTATGFHVNVGINQPTPTQALHISFGTTGGTGSSSNNAAIQLDSSTGSVPGANSGGILFVDNSSPTRLKFVNQAGTLVDVPTQIPTAGNLLYGNGSFWTSLAVGTASQVLTVSGGFPSWQTPGAGSGTVTSIGLATPNSSVTFAGSSANPIITSGTFNIDVSNLNFNNFNMFYGPSSGNNSFTGIRNTAFGTNCLTAITAASNNTAIGAFNLQSVTTSGFNTVIGYSNLGLLSLTASGGNNTAIGTGHLGTLVSGSWNIAIGTNVLTSSAHDSSNIGIGQSALIYLNGGNSNTALGDLAGPGIFGSPNTYNNCTFLGALSNLTNVTLTYATAIGAGATISASNAMNLGGGSSGVINVGINQPTPANSLHVSIGTVASSAAISMDVSSAAPTIGAGYASLYVTSVVNPANTLFFQTGTSGRFYTVPLVRISGGNPSSGTATLGTGGTVTVLTNVCTSSSIIFVNYAAGGAVVTAGILSVGAAGGGFTITSTNPLDTNNVNWFIINGNY